MNILRVNLLNNYWKFTGCVPNIWINCCRRALKQRFSSQLYKKEAYWELLIQSIIGVCHISCNVMSRSSSKCFNSLLKLFFISVTPFPFQPWEFFCQLKHTHENILFPSWFWFLWSQYVESPIFLKTGTPYSYLCLPSWTDLLGRLIQDVSWSKTAIFQNLEVRDRISIQEDPLLSN